jgi:hypothetical protein
MIHRPQHPDPSVKQRTSAFRRHDESLYSGLPVRQLLLSFRELLDVIGCAC